MTDHRLLSAYVGELEALRVHGRELAESFPDVAARLDIGPRRSRDPHVERVVESAAFLAARLRLQLEDQSAELPMGLLSILAPTLQEPVPAMAIADLHGGSETQRIARGTRFDLSFGQLPLVCLSTTMAVTAAPYSIRIDRADTGNMPDGISLKLFGRPPPTLDLYIGNNPLNAALLIDALADDLVAIEVVPPDGGDATRLPTSSLRILGFHPDEAALPVRPASHESHRLVTEFIAFPEKFSFVSLAGAGFAHGTEIRLQFSQPLPFDHELPRDLITVNRVPLINLWPTAGTPFNIDGRQLEYPIRVDAQRYRVAECHSVEDMHLYGAGDSHGVRLDPLLATGDIQDTAIRWGVRRTVSPAGGEVMVYFKGLDYRTMGRQGNLAAPRLLASNGDLPRRARVGESLLAVDGLGGWQARLATVPTTYHPAMVDAQAMRTLISYMQSSLHSLASDGCGYLRPFLRKFPGADTASWIDGIGRVTVQPVVANHDGIPRPELRVFLSFDATRSPTTSRTLVKRVLATLFDSQRSLNRVEQLVVVNT